MSDALARLDARIAELQAARKVLVELDGDLMPPRDSKRIQKLRAKLSGSKGTSKVVLDVIRAGADTPAQIQKQAKVSAYVARHALKALLDGGRVTREGNTNSTRYHIAK